MWIETAAVMVKNNHVVFLHRENAENWCHNKKQEYVEFQKLDEKQKAGYSKEHPDLLLVDDLGYDVLDVSDSSKSS